jgi:hypothetical protein
MKSPALTPVPEMHLEHARVIAELGLILSEGLSHWVSRVGVKEAARVLCTTIEAVVELDTKSYLEQNNLEELVRWWGLAGGTFDITLTRPIVHR